MASETPSPARRRLLEHLKRAGPASVAEIADALGMTGVAVRQHLRALAEDGLVRDEARPAAGRGRPSSAWRVTGAADAHFPDHHGELTVGLLGAMRSVFGEAGLARIVAERGREQIAAYRQTLPGASASLKSRVQALAAARTREGYMAEVQEEKRGRYLLIEHHCPICDAARSCAGLCANELEVFQAALGEEVSVERTQHLLAGDPRCVYRIERKRS